MSFLEERARLGGETTSPGRARRFVAEAATSWGREDLADAAALLVSELVTNAVLHGRPPIEVVVRTSGPRLRVEVADTSPTAPARKRYSPLSTTGRGLLLVDELADEWGVLPIAGGKVVWFEVGDRRAREPSSSGLVVDLDRFAESDW